MSDNAKYKLEIVAGPCGAETRDQMLRTATELKQLGIHMFRAGLWKPRSRYGSFEGVGEVGLEWMNEIQKTLDMKVFTEVALPAHVDAVLRANMDGVWIGARTSVNPFMISELGEALRGVSIPVWVKNPIVPDVKLWIGAIERLLKANVNNIKIIHRGFYLLDNLPYRNTPLWHLIDVVRQEYPNIPIFCDPSHIAGKRSLIDEVCKTALSFKTDGLFIESHCCPDLALSDSEQQLTPNDLSDLLESLGV